MFKLNSGSNRENLLNSRFKYQCDEKRIRKIRRTLLTLAEIDMKTSKLYNVTVIKNEENENKMEAETIISQKSYHEDLKIIKQNEINIETKINFNPSELADSSDLDNEDDEC